MSEDRPAQVTGTARLRGRQAQAAHNDELILQAAREVFLADPTAPISAVAERAGVGIGALYHRYASKEDLLRTLCRTGQEIYLAEIRRALASDDEPWEAWTGFLRRSVAANTHGLTVRLAGTFAPSAEQFALAEEMRSLAIELFERVRDTGMIRDDVPSSMSSSCGVPRRDQARRRHPFRRTAPTPPSGDHRRIALRPGRSREPAGPHARPTADVAGADRALAHALAPHGWAAPSFCK